MRCLSQSWCLVLQWRNYYNSQLIRRMLNLPFPERPCLEWVRLCRDCTRPFWPRMAELILSWEYIIVVVLHLFTGTDCFYRINFLAFSMSKMRQLSAWEHVNLNNYHRGHTISSTYNFPSLWAQGHHIFRQKIMQALNLEKVKTVKRCVKAMFAVMKSGFFRYSRTFTSKVVYGDTKYGSNTGHLTSDVWYQASDIRRLISESWHKTYDIRHLKLDVWHQTFEIRGMKTDV